jgi:GTPase SAR1 family protein
MSMKFGSGEDLNRSTFADNIFKVVIVGNQDVGKSSIIKRYIENSFDEEKVRTFGRSYFDLRS